MNIAIFGASGATGNLLTERCLAGNHNVTALLRTPEKFPFRDRVRVIQVAQRLSRLQGGGAGAMPCTGAREATKKRPRIPLASERKQPRGGEINVRL